jgi:hypothetical protein
VRRLLPSLQQFEKIRIGLNPGHLEILKECVNPIENCCFSRVKSVPVCRNWFKKKASKALPSELMMLKKIRAHL